MENQNKYKRGENPKCRNGFKKGNKVWLGKKLSTEHKEKLRLSKLGKNNPMFGKTISEETRKKKSISNTGNKHTLETKRKIGLKNSGENSNLWRGGVTKTNALIRCSLEYKLWRTSVFERDGYTCIWCQRKGGLDYNTKERVVLNADHIKPFSLFPELRLAIDNGRTLCKDCHKTTDTYGWNLINKYKKDKKI